MQLETVESGAIHAIGYDRGSQILEVIFTTGRVYQFTRVPPEQYQALRNAESKGRYFAENIRDAFPYWSFHSPRKRNSRTKRGASQ